MPKAKFNKYYLSEKNVSTQIKLLKKIKSPFILSVSNYTVKIEAPNPAYNCYFMKNEQSNKVFAAGKMIEKDLKRFDIPEIDMQKNEYFSLGLTDSFYADKMYNIDIKSAYATILFNDGFITKKTFKYICSLQKMERLAALGMIAGRKNVFSHSKSGKIISNEEVINPLSPFFFYCVQKTNNIILDVKNKIMLSSFIFSWVDGIYYNDPSASLIAQEYIFEEYKLKTTLKELTEFEVKKEDEFFDIVFMDGADKKTFAIPVPETHLKKKIIAHLLNKDHEEIKKG